MSAENPDTNGVTYNERLFPTDKAEDIIKIIIRYAQGCRPGATITVNFSEEIPENIRSQVARHTYNSGVYYLPYPIRVYRNANNGFRIEGYDHDPKVLGKPGTDAFL